MSQKPNDKVTIYCNSEWGMGMIRIEGSLVGHGTKPYAQYDNAAYVVFVPKRKRKPRMLRGTSHSYLLVLKGHGHPDPANPMVEIDSGSQVTVERSRYRSCDPRWETDLDEVLDAYIAEAGIEVVADYRYTKGFNPHDRFAPGGRIAARHISDCEA